ncbi:hypothetical protein TYRP_003092 [Tyrophagus putrescentiae]|nr:hypothetical protein TYRP_003092 [Tyrophagus putrescentiae]
MANLFLTAVLFILNNQYPLLCTRSNVMLERIYRIKVLRSTDPHHSFKHFVVWGFYLMKAVIYTYLAILPLRGLAMGNILSAEQFPAEYLTTEYLYIDPLITLGVLNFTFFDQKTMFATTLLALFALYIDYSLSFQSNLAITRMMYEINIGNIEEITKLNGLLALIFFFLFTFLFLFVDLPTWPVISFAFFDCVLITYCAWNAVRMGFFSLHVIAMQAFIARGRVGELNGAITGAVQSCRTVAKTGGGNNKAAALQLKRAVAIFRQEHRHLHEVAVTINDLVSSRLMIVTFLTNIFNNVMMIAKLIFEPLLPMEAAAVFLIILAQTTISLPACFVQITWAKALYSEASIHLLYVSQPMLTNDEQSGAKFGNNNGLGDGGLFGAVMLVEKLKLNLYFELVCTQSSFMFTLGQLGGISKKSLFEFFLGYSGFILYASKMFIRNRLVKNAALANL